MDLSRWTLVTALLCIASVVAKEETTKRNGRSIFINGPCFYDQFQCSNDKCITKSQFCNGHNDCGDNSDEQFCSYNNCPETPPRFTCYIRYGNSDRCIPLSWQCDGQVDCLYGKDEQNCVINDNVLSLNRIQYAKRSAIRWIIISRNDENLSGNKWGSQVARKAVAWYLSNQDTFIENNTFFSEMAYEVRLDLLAKTSSKKLKDISSSELATYVNAFLVTCIDPRRFYGMDLVSELRGRVDLSNNTHPFVILALCNAGTQISEEDIVKTVRAFRNAQQNYRTDIQSLAVMALSCAADQNPSLLDDVDMSELTLELKKKQYRNGTVESLKTTALVLQALYASEAESDEDNFDEEKALMQILKYQKEDDSFGNMVNTYYVLPLLAYRSLVNISSSHCAPRGTDETDALQELLNLGGHKSTVRFSIWVGNDRTLQRTITLKVPSNSSFYGVMEWAARVDKQFRFEYSMRERKPHIYSISGIQDDPENSNFWFLYTEGDKRTLLTQSPFDVIPKNGQHLVFWYKSEE